VKQEGTKKDVTEPDLPLVNSVGDLTTQWPPLEVRCDYRILSFVYCLTRSQPKIKSNGYSGQRTMGFLKNYKCGLVNHKWGDLALWLVVTLSVQGADVKACVFNSVPA